MTRAVVFAYHNVGVRCLEVLRAGGADVALVITHEDDPAETHWFDSVAARTALYGMPTITPEDPNAPEVLARVQAARPDILFSFYYRSMLGQALLDLPRLGAFNMHGSLLPKYRGRAPVNWAVLNGETETGATLHEMVAKPDAGRIVDQQRVPILPNDLAREVFEKVTLAAEMVLERGLTQLLAGTARFTPQDLAAGGYFGRRRPEDGAIDPAWPALRVHNMVRAVAPPYPGASCAIAGGALRLLRTLDTGERGAPAGSPALLARGAQLHLRCGDGGVLRVLESELDGQPLDGSTLRHRFGTDCLSFNSVSGNT